MEVTQLGPVEIDEESVATVKYAIGGAWVAEISRPIHTAIGGPHEIRIWSNDYDTNGLQDAHLKAIPLKEARNLLEEAWVYLRAHELVDAIPDDFDVEYAYARLAEAIVTLTGWKVRQPMAVIARAKEGKTPDRQARDRWSTRAKRAKSYGYLVDVGGECALTAKASALLRGV